MPVVRANGIKIHYEERGRGDPLILIMGLGADGSLWEDHVSEYGKHFRCILMDNRGAGHSDKPEGAYTTEMMAADTAGLMDALGIENARVAGISMGSTIAQHLALAHPEKVRSLVLVSSWARCDPYMRTVFEHFKKLRPLADPADFVRILQLWIFTPGHYDTHQEDMAEGVQEAVEKYMPLHAYQAQCDACAEHDTLDRLPGIQAATLITVGDADIFTPLPCSIETDGRMPKSELLVFPGRGNCHHWEDLEKFNASTADFLLSH